MKSAYTLLALMLLQLLPWGVTPAMADDDHLEARRLMELGDVLPLQTILEKYRTDYPGRVIEVELEKKHGRMIYEIEIIDDRGEVRELYIDARNAELLKVKVDH
ncbi:MAG TPA: PepSY domain-containing protein [Gammaproteobacteria bacterium]